MPSTGHPPEKLLAKAQVTWLAVICIVLVLVSAWGVPAPSASFFKEYAATWLIGILFLIWLWQSRQANFTVFNWTWEKLPLLLLFVYGSFSLFWADNIDFFVNKWLSWFSALLLFWMATRIEPSKENLTKLAIGLIIAVDLLVIIGISQHLFDFPDQYLLPQKESPASTFSNKNIAAQVVVLLFPIAFFVLFSTLSQFKTWWITFSIALMLTYVFYTAARSVWLSFFVEVTLITIVVWFNRKLGTWMHWNKQKTNASIIATITFLILINFPQLGFILGWENFSAGNLESTKQEFTPAGKIFSENLISIVDSAGNLESARYKIWQSSINMIIDAPVFGHGLGHFFYNGLSAPYILDGLVVKQVHNDLLETTVELGLVGLILLLLFVFSMVKIWFSLLKNTQISTHWFYTLIIIALSGSFVNMLLSFPYQKILPLLIFALFTGLFLTNTLTHQRIISTNKYALSTKKKLTFATFSVLIVLTTIAIHQNWMNGFKRINTEISKGAKQANVAWASNTWFYHPEKFLLLNSLNASDLRYEKYHHALNISQANLEMFPNNPMTLYKQGMAFVGLKQYEQAFELVKKIKNTKHALSYLGLMLEIRLNLETNNKTQILIAYDKFIKQQGYDFLVEENMALFYARQQDYKNAAKHYKRILEDYPKKANKNQVIFLIQQGLLPASALRRLK